MTSWLWLCLHDTGLLFVLDWFKQSDMKVIPLRWRFHDTGLLFIPYSFCLHDNAPLFTAQHTSFVHTSLHDQLFCPVIFFGAKDFERKWTQNLEVQNEVPERKCIRFTRLHEVRSGKRRTGSRSINIIKSKCPPNADLRLSNIRNEMKNCMQIFFWLPTEQRMRTI